jgi:hypothetical protein
MNTAITNAFETILKTATPQECQRISRERMAAANAARLEGRMDDWNRHYGNAMKAMNEATTKALEVPND